MASRFSFRSSPRFLATFLAVAVGFPLISPSAWGQGPATDLTQKVAELNRQLGQGANAAAWRKFLMLDSLEAQLAAGARPDKKAAELVLARFSGSERQLAWAPVVAVRHSLAAWLDSFPPPPVADLPKLLRDEKAKFVPHTPAQVAAAKAETLAALDRLKRYLATGPQGPGWTSYLYLEALEGQLKAETPDVEELQQIRRQFVSGKVGLELPIFANVGRSLGSYLDATTAIDTPQSREAYAANLESLAAGVEKLDKEPAVAVQDSYRWLAVAAQVRPLLAAVRHYYSKPNLRVDLSESFMASRANREVDMVTPVSDNILGTRITGTGRTRGQVVLNLIPDANQAIYELNFTGNVHSTTVGRNGPAVIHSLGGTSFNARKLVVLNGEGITPYQTQVAARTSSTTTGVGVTIRVPVVKRIVQKIAEKKVAEKKDEGNRVGARHAEQKISRKFDEEIVGELSKANVKFKDFFVLGPQRYGQPTDQVRFSSSEDRMYVIGTHANAWQLASPSDPPALDGMDLAVRLHESSLNNLGEAIAGQTWHDQQLKADLKNLGIELPKRLEPENEEEAEPGTITFAEEKPLILNVADGVITLTIRAQGFTRGEKQHEGMDITVAYKLDKADSGIVARRTGKLRVRPPGFKEGDKLSLGQTTVVKLVEKTFNKIFAEDVQTTIEFKKGPNPDSLVLTSHSAEKGWLALGWNRKAPTRTAQAR